jgi:hypothetical protein
MPTRTTPRSRIGRTPAHTGGRFSRTPAPTSRRRPLARKTTSKSQGGLKGIVGALPSLARGSSKAGSSRGSKGKSAFALVAAGAAGLLGRKQMRKRKGSHHTGTAAT